METDGGWRRRHDGVIGNNGEQGPGERRRIIAGLQYGADGADLAITMCVGIERVRYGTALRGEQQQP